MPSTSSSRKPPTERSIASDQLPEYQLNDKIEDFSKIDEGFCPQGYNQKLNKDKATFYKIVECSVNEIPIVTKAIVINSSLNVGLFLRGTPIPLPQWFRKGSDCRLKSKAALDNFPAYIRNYEASQNQAKKAIVDELQQIKYKKPDNGPKYSLSVLQFALLLRYTSLLAYKLIKEVFPLPSLSLLTKLSRGGVEPLKAVKLLLE